MKNVPDALRKRQALLISDAVTLLCVSLYVTFAHQKRMAEISDRMSSMVAHTIELFNDNELIADAAGVRFQHIRGTRECGGLEGFAPRGGESWAING